MPTPEYQYYTVPGHEYTVQRGKKPVQQGARGSSDWDDHGDDVYRENGSTSGPGPPPSQDGEPGPIVIIVVIVIVLVILLVVAIFILYKKRSQLNVCCLKEEKKTPPKDLSEVDISKRPPMPLPRPDSLYQAVEYTTDGYVTTTGAEEKRNRVHEENGYWNPENPGNQGEGPDGRDGQYVEPHVCADGHYEYVNSGYVGLVRGRDKEDEEAASGEEQHRYLVMNNGTT